MFEKLSQRYRKLVSIIWQISQSQPEVLKEKIQFFLSEFLSNLAFNKFSQAIFCLEGLDEFLYLSTSSGKLRMINYEILRGEIEKLKEEIREREKLFKQGVEELDLREVFLPLKERKNEEEIEKKRTPSLSIGGLNARQLKILEIIKERKKVKSLDLFEIFPQVSQKTLRADLKALLERGLLFKQGTNRNLWYLLNPKFSFSQENPA
ncbi:hypothetical protein J7J37_00980 [bacterium]|nr:hypothetical protein [bacterium]